MSTSGIYKMAGKHLVEKSFLYGVYKNEIDVVPGIIEDAVRSRIWLCIQKHCDFKLNLIADAD
ncbi:MAG: deoxyhypusine synthase [Nitrosarchaeum sp.]|nr:deoxyhypusine synthase [Nitrosarchaeum sp.]